MGVLLANCRAAGLGGFAVTEGEDDLEVTSILQRAHHARRRAESVARLLLSRLDRSCAGHMTSSGGCQPWEDVSTNSRTASTSSTSSSTELDFAKTDELRLREHIQQLKTERSAVRTTVMELESAHVDPLALEPRGRVEAQRLDLENAVLVQELMAVKEEKAELKARSYLLEKEKRALELRLSGKETQETAYRIQIEHLQGELELVAGEHPPHAPLTSPSPSSPRSGASGHQYHHHHQSSRTTTASSKQQQQQQQHLPDAWKVTEMASRDANDLARDFLLSLERERVLKWRVSELMSTLEKISRNSESGHKQWAQFVNDLKRANSALISAFDKARKKYQGRLKKMEGQLKGWKEKYDADTAALRQRLSVLEGTRGGGGGVRTPPTPQPPPSETSL
ncbi:colorectal mutant cancer protein [Aplysia californica]|uniref:Colorectal mutant cancer protein n=1 Tax=Aplysia californica TaxID=6500 RepID=A0ABM0JN56_APLCA|nr:colorectal mutant cancer protein [Aplysia californica]